MCTQPDKQRFGNGGILYRSMISVLQDPGLSDTLQLNMMVFYRILYQTSVTCLFDQVTSKQTSPVVCLSTSVF